METTADNKTNNLSEDYVTIQAVVAQRWLPNFCDRILEVGCSSGYFTQRIANRAREVYGIDVNAEHIAQAQKKYPYVHFQALAADTLPFEDDLFDAIVMLEVYEHVPDREKLIKEVYRVLKPGGMLILSTPNTGLFAFMDTFNLKVRFLRRFPRLAKYLSEKVQRFKNTQYTDNISWHPHFSLAQVRMALTPKLKIEQVHRGGLFIFPLFALIRSVLVRMIPSRALFKGAVAVMNLDGKIPYGPLAYNLIVQARKVES